MIDHKKRRLFKLGGMATVGALLPAVVTAKVRELQVKTTPLKTTGGTLKDGNLTIKIISGKSPSMRVTNTGEKLAIFNQLNPGMIEIDGQIFNLNAALGSSAYAIGAGRSRSIPIQKVCAEFSGLTSTRLVKNPRKLVTVMGNSAEDRLQLAPVMLA